MKLWFMLFLFWDLKVMVFYSTLIAQSSS